MHKAFRRLSFAVVGAAVLTLAACGGGSSVAVSTPLISGSTSLSGTAAVGAPISGIVVAIDVNGKTSPPATTSAAGAFIVDVSGLTAPYLLNIIGTANGKAVTLNSVATAAGQTVNITPLTDLIVSTASGRPGGTSLANLCAPTVTAECKAALAAASTPANLNAAVTAVTNMIAPLNTAGTNPLTGAFTANGSGFDAILDQILVSPATGQSGDSAIATITLISTNSPLGTVTLPATAGTVASTQATTLSPADLTKAQAAATVLPEIKTCMASFNALYSGSSLPSTGDHKGVDNYIDSSFNFGVGAVRSDFIDALVNDLAYSGFALNVTGLASYDMSPLTSGELTTVNTVNGPNAGKIAKQRSTSAIAYDGSGAPTSAWVKFQAGSDAGLVSWKMVKGSAYSGCAGGWKIAGSQHIDMHMNARVNQLIDSSGNATYTRELAVHIEKDPLQTENSAVTYVIVRGPGFSQYGGPTTPVGISRRVKVVPSAEINLTVDGEGSSYYVLTDAIQSCQDLAAAGVPLPSTGTISCFDETASAPGAVYGWELRNSSNVTVQAFPFELSSVPLSKAFAQANASNLFAKLTSKTPANLTALASTISSYTTGQAMDDIFTYYYTQGTAYNSRMDNCRLGLSVGGSPVLISEQPAIGHETGCTFRNDQMSGSLAKPAGTLSGGYVGLTTSVLGNQASSSRPF